MANLITAKLINSQQKGGGPYGTLHPQGWLATACISLRHGKFALRVFSFVAFFYFAAIFWGLFLVVLLNFWLCCCIPNPLLSFCFHAVGIVQGCSEKNVIVIFFLKKRWGCSWAPAGQVKQPSLTKLDGAALCSVEIHFRVWADTEGTWRAWRSNAHPLSKPASCLKERMKERETVRSDEEGRKVKEGWRDQWVHLTPSLAQPTLISAKLSASN